MPWSRNIYIVTCRPQAPDWLDRFHPRVKVVHHDEIFVSKEYLPTFNSNAIESYLHRIPNLSDPFLYLNDDFLFGRPITIKDFITEDNKIKVFGTFFGERLRFRIYEEKFKFVSYAFIEHAPILILKEAWASMLKKRPGQVQKTRRHRFRADDDLRMDRLYRYYMLSKMRRFGPAEKNEAQILLYER